MDLRKSRYILPNLFTLASVFFGVYAIAACFEQTLAGYKRAAIAILIAGVADSLDGRVARMTRTATRFGIQLDSLADVLSFGMAPAILAWAFCLKSVEIADGIVAVIVAFTFTACGAMRLARFNIQADEKGPSDKFTGLPIPAAAGTVSLIVWSAIDIGIPEPFMTVFLSAVLITLGMLMVSTIPYPSFKHIRFGPLGRLIMFVVVAGVIILAWSTRTSIVLLVIALIYVTLGPVDWLLHLPARIARLKRRRDEEHSET